ncbi:ethanolamine utilization protein [Clostridium tagluense]|uniref:ethanolamine utilization protein n=1 Tax=Clostridium tagluense TaxID=360422 RepID=UPI001C0D2EB5|nr:ethanolamine utilization protein [Clostridium tagluense]MBU3128308.1 ethanolamine utilization protein [Clostridium tagluense]MBW9157634.1 ethanolamine utilization protein [Clostridium tagluense]MCB2310793.1 ethanolamine utilization protein [Clostridium tagluense]MCB2315477.1 ethanolamine utilization protein [Clostridium tagluense]MCB2320330.1 ethanolamine utilization protein [Clostridium tagluense]
MENIDAKLIEDMVRKIIIETLSKEKCEFEKHIDPSGIMSVKLNTVKLDKFDTGKEKDDVLLKDVLTLEESPRLGCGLMEMKETCFDWTLKYDEIDYVIDGTLEVNIDGRKVVANKGEIILIPKNSKIQFSVPNYAKFMYVTYPANWAELE